MTIQQFVTIMIQRYFAPQDYTFTVADNQIDIFERYVTDTTKALRDFVEMEAEALTYEHPECEYETFQFDGFEVSWYYALI